MLVRSSLSLFLTCVVLVCGCTPGNNVDSKLEEQNKDRIQKVLSSYTLYSSRMMNKPPKSKEDIIEFIQTGEKLERPLSILGITKDEIADIFVSDRDGEEYVIRWGTKTPEGAGQVPLVFEKTGVDGVRKVVLSDYRVLEVSDDKNYDELMKGNVPDEYKVEVATGPE